MKGSRRRIRSSFLAVNEQRYIVAPFHWFLAPVPNDYYQFQQFRINQRDCAMEMSTDACVLGTTHTGPPACWIPAPSCWP